MSTNALLLLFLENRASPTLVKMWRGRNESWQKATIMDSVQNRSAMMSALGITLVAFLILVVVYSVIRYFGLDGQNFKILFLTNVACCILLSAWAGLCAVWYYLRGSTYKKFISDLRDFEDLISCPGRFNQEELQKKCDDQLVFLALAVINAENTQGRGSVAAIECREDFKKIHGIISRFSLADKLWDRYFNLAQQELTKSSTKT